MAINQLDREDPPSTEASERALAYSEAMSEAFRQAERRAGAVDRYYSIGGHAVRLRFAGPGLVPYLAPALAHLRVELPVEPELVISLWDSASTGTKLPVPPWATADHLARGEIRGHNDQRIRTVYQPVANTVSILDCHLNEAVYWVPDVRAIPFWESSAPLRTILHWWMSLRGKQLVHSAAVGTAGGGVLIAGKGGSGKSTAALACLQSELIYAGDDYVLLSVDPLPHVYSLYNSAKLNGDHAWRFPHLAAAIANPDKLETEKAVIYLRDNYPERLGRDFPVHALLLPRVVPCSTTRVREVSPSESLRAVAPSTIFQLPGAGQEALRTVARCIAMVPSYVLDLSPDIGQIPGVILQLLRNRQEFEGSAADDIFTNR